MTTKELLRRLESFSSLDVAASKFSDVNTDFVFRVEVCTINNSKRVYYTLSYIVTIDDVVNYLSVSRFTRQLFDIQVKYFKSFYLRCSKSQRDYITKSLLVDNLLKLL